MFQNPIKIERDALVKIIDDRSCRCSETPKEESVEIYKEELKQVAAPIRKDNFVTARRILRNICSDCEKSDSLKEELQGWLKRNYQDAHESYDTFLYNETQTSVLNVRPVAPVYSPDSPEVPGRQILRDNYDVLFSRIRCWLHSAKIRVA